MNVRSGLLVAVLGAVACGGDGGSAGGDGDGGVVGGEPDAGSPGDMCGDTRAAHRVYYGTENPSYVPLLPGQVWAIGTWGGCSGTLIAPTWVLTATHCGLRAGDEFCIGEDPKNANVCMATINVYDNPAADMTLGQLGVDATVQLPGVIPVPIMTESLDAMWIGRLAEAAGYGQQEDGGYGEREFTAEPIDELSGHTMTINGEGMHGVCFGDSGGPVFVVATDGTVRAAGDLSNGDGNCIGRDNFTRTDTNVDWIEDFTGPTVVDGAQCGSIDVAGRCNGGLAMWCGDDDLLQTEQCAGACGWDADAQGYRCIEGADSCGGFDGRGGCEAGVAHWCEAGVPKSRDCTACGQVCSLVPGVGADCIDDPCNGLDYLGQCNGNVAEWCENGQPQSRDCTESGKTCGYIDDEIGYYCQ